MAQIRQSSPALHGNPVRSFWVDGSSAAMADPPTNNAAVTAAVMRFRSELDMGISCVGFDSLTSAHAVVVSTFVGVVPSDGAGCSADGGSDSGTLPGTPARVASDDGADGGPSGSAANGTADDAGRVAS